MSPWEAPSLAPAMKLESRVGFEPTCGGVRAHSRYQSKHRPALAPVEGFEPPTATVETSYSHPLSYTGVCMVEPSGLEPETSKVQT